MPARHSSIPVTRQDIQPRKDSDAALFRNRLKKIRRIQDTRTRAHRILLALGYVIALTPRGVPAFTRALVRKGSPVVVWLTDESREGLPASLRGPAWAGFYARDDSDEMVYDEDYPTLIDFLREMHPEQMRAAPEVMSDN